MSERARGGFVEWLLIRRGVAAARASLPARGPRAEELLRRGACARELADRTFDPVDPLRSGTADFLALELYRVAAYFHLAAALDAPEAPDLRRAWDASPEDLLLFAADGAEGRGRIAMIFFDSSVAEDAALPIDEQRRRAGDARAFVHALARKLEGRDSRVARLLVQRYLRIAVAIALLGSVVLACVELVGKLVEPADLAAGKPFATSSTWEDGDFDPIGHTVLHGTVPLLIHTNEEENPWVEIDLGSVRPIGSIKVVNRSDCCTDRAVPLVVEVSADHAAYVEVARRTDSFGSWHTRFPTHEGRWVRLRVPRRTWLHLEQVSIYGP